MSENLIFTTESQRVQSVAARPEVVEDESGEEKAKHREGGSSRTQAY
jgi:hypothetical protein